VNFIWRLTDRNGLSAVAAVCREMKSRETFMLLHINNGIEIYVDRFIFSG
jgi:hypothetical protein